MIVGTLNLDSSGGLNSVLTLRIQQINILRRTSSLERVRWDGFGKCVVWDFTSEEVSPPLYYHDDWFVWGVLRSPRLFPTAEPGSV